MIQCAVYLTFTLHYNCKASKVSDVSENFHVYGLEWTPDKLKFYVDDIHYFTYQPEIKL